MPNADFEPNVSELVANNAGYADDTHDAAVPVDPSRRLAVVACMDARMDIHEILGLENGEAHIIRNGGGVVTDDVIRSLSLSQRYLGTKEIVLLHHTDCGLSKVGEDQFRSELLDEIGVMPAWALDSFTDPFVSVRQSIRRIELSPFVFDSNHITGFVFDVTSGLLREVALADPS